MAYLVLNAFVLLQETEQNLLMSIIMDTYNRIFTRMENDSKDEATKEKLEHVKDHLEELQKNYFPGKSAELKTYAETLWAIKVRQPFFYETKLDTKKP